MSVRSSTEEEKMMKKFLLEEDGQTLVEYGLLVSLLALVVIAVLTTLGKRVQTVFNVASEKINTTA
jgi:pilus assembly protein Flp/PilA